MSYAVGIAYAVSMVVLTVVLSVVYSICMEAFAPPGRIVRQSLRRAGKLAGVLAVLAIVVYLLSR